MQDASPAIAIERKRSAVPGWMAGATFTARERLIVLAVFALLVLLRLPEASLHGRLMTEEGPIFLAYAWHRETWDALWRSFGGYLNLAANASTLLAARLAQHGLLPLEHVPRLTMGIALAFQVVPAALILWGRGTWLTARWVYLASLLMIALAPFSEEVWLNVLHIQFHLTLACALILVLEPPATRRGWAAQGFVLLLAPLCGPGALMLGPLFLARTCIDRSLARMAQTAVLGLGGLIQLLVFFTSSPVRGQMIDLPSLATTIFIRLAAMPLTGIRSATGLGRLAYWAREHQNLAWWLISGLSFAFCALIVWAIWRWRHQATGWLFAIGLALALGCFGGGMIATDAGGWFNVLAGERYNFLSVTIWGIAVVAIVQDRAFRWNPLAKLLCGLVFLTGAISYLHPIPEMSEGPNWQAQVRLWRADHSHGLQIWPAGWPVDLSDEDRPCPKPDLKTATGLDPGYCESAWLAKVAPNPTEFARLKALEKR